MASDQFHAVDARFLPDPVLAIDGDLRVEFANPAACELFELELGELVGMRLGARVAEVDLAALTVLIASARQGRSLATELAVQCALGGPPCRLSIRALPTDAASGNSIKLVLRDLTQLDRLAEESCRRAHLERTPGQFMLTLDSAGRIEHAVGLDSVLGHAPRAWIGHAVGDLIDEDEHLHGLVASIQLELADVGRWTSVERCVRSDGSQIPVHLFATQRVDPLTHAPGGYYLSGLSLPHRLDTPRESTIVARARARIREEQTGEKPTVLVADDDATMRAVVRHLLERGGYDVVESASGRDALSRLRQGVLPHFLIADLRMADGSGGWLVSQVGYEFPLLLPRTVVISGDASSAAAAHVTARWHCPVLAKPFNGAQLVSTLVALASGNADVA